MTIVYLYWLHLYIHLWIFTFVHLHLYIYMCTLTFVHLHLYIYIEWLRTAAVSGGCRGGAHASLRNQDLPGLKPSYHHTIIPYVYVYLYMCIFTWIHSSFTFVNWQLCIYMLVDLHLYIYMCIFVFGHLTFVDLHVNINLCTFAFVHLHLYI